MRLPCQKKMRTPLLSEPEVLASDKKRKLESNKYVGFVLFYVVVVECFWGEL